MKLEELEEGRIFSHGENLYMVVGKSENPKFRAVRHIGTYISDKWFGLIGDYLPLRADIVVKPLAQV